MATKVYIASHFPNRFMLKMIIPELEKKYNLKCTSKWIYSEGSDNLKDEVDIDLKGIDEADFVIAVYPWGEGTKCEMCYAMGAEKRVVAIIETVLFPNFHHIKMNKFSEYFPLGKFEFWRSPNTPGFGYADKKDWKVKGAIQFVNICDYPFHIVGSLEQLDECIKHNVSIFEKGTTPQ